MRFMSLYKPGKDLDGPPDPEVMAKLGTLIEQMMNSGALIATDGLQASSRGARVRIEDERITVTDGPFAETKEVIAGYAILNAKSKEEAIGMAKRFLAVMGEGECEVRPMHEEAQRCAS